MSQQAATASVQSEYNQAVAGRHRRAAGKRRVFCQRSTRSFPARKWRSWPTASEIEQKRLAISAQSVTSQIAAQQAPLESNSRPGSPQPASRFAARNRRHQRRICKRRPSKSASKLAPGTNLARVADPKSLKAALQIQETQVKDVQLNQPVLADTRGGVINGRVMRIDLGGAQRDCDGRCQIRGRIAPSGTA
ncbi:MAG: hypothetical protein WKF84_22440 [Pyrinomonadaceae bacterium]